jgi:uncharacterized membrane protein YphA (DoxX/SURF4 family)
MNQTERFNALALLCVRVAITMILIGAVIHLYHTGGAATPRGNAKPWIGPDAPTVIPLFVYAAVLTTGALLLLAGWQTPVAAIAIGALLIVVTVERLVRNPFTNLTADIAIFLALTLSLLAAGPERDRFSLDAFRGRTALAPLTRWSCITLFARLFIGAIFFMQGFRNLFLTAGPIVFAERLYVKPFGGMMPEPLLWIAGVSNPFVQFGVGSLLIAGLFTRSAAAVGALFLLTIIFGHLMEGALQAPAAMRDAAIANFIAMIAVILLASRGNRWSVDALLFRKTET